MNSILSVTLYFLLHFSKFKTDNICLIYNQLKMDTTLIIHCPNSFFSRFFFFIFGSCRLPSHSPDADAHRNFFQASFFKLKSKFWLNMPYLARWAVQG